MKKKILAVLLSAAMVAAMAMGCSSGGGTSAKADGEKAGKAEDMTFVVVPKCVHAWFDEVNKGAQKEADLLAEQLGVKVKIDYRAPESAEVSAQNSTLEQAAATNPTAILLGEDWPMNSIAASVIGGVALTGGVGNPAGALIGAAVITIIQNIIVLFGVNSYWQSAVSGIVVVLAISFSSISTIVRENRQKRIKLN